MKYSAKQYAKALFESLESTDHKDQDKVLDNFANVLSENNDLRLFEAIAEEFHKLELAAKGMKQAEVISAHAISGHMEKEILDEVNKLVKGKAELKKKIDEDLIGGVVIRVDDLEIDASVRNSLLQLKSNLIK